MVKRTFDIVAAVLGLIVVSPVMAIAAVLIKLDSPGPALFRQERIGRHFRPFFIYKFRTMTHDPGRVAAALASSRSPDLTRVGAWIRRAKIDELPQLMNVLAGDMSIVGPRPELACYVEMFRHDYEEILAVRPGITDPASLAFVDETAQLERAARPELEYREVVLPQKIAMAKQYVHESNLLLDLSVIVRTVCRLSAPRV
jgi:lipopolysaccharide/colanic/teichoic acid biosynthesis glycosyltransferase